MARKKGEKLNGVVENVRGVAHPKMHQVIVRVEGIATRADAEKLLHRHAYLHDHAGHRVPGKVVALHGNHGRVRLHLHRGVSPDDLNRAVEII